VISVGCIGEKGESEGKVKGAPLSVKIEKVVYPEAIFGKELDVSINITNIGKEDIDLGQFEYYIYKYDPNLKAYQENRLYYFNLPTLGPTASYKITHLMLCYLNRPRNEEKYKFIMKKMPEKWGEESKKVLEIEFSVTPEDWDNPDLYRYGK